MSNRLYPIGSYKFSLCNSLQSIHTIETQQQEKEARQLSMNKNVKTITEKRSLYDRCRNLVLFIDFLELLKDMVQLNEFSCLLLNCVEEVLDIPVLL